MPHSTREKGEILVIPALEQNNRYTEIGLLPEDYSKEPAAEVPGRLLLLHLLYGCTVKGQHRSHCRFQHTLNARTFE